MGTLKPIGSEKLEGASKIARIMEIARYKEALPTQEKSLQTESYSVQLADGNTYRILHEKNGYIIQKTVNESFDYIEPMKNRKYYSSYSEAFKRVNLIAKELNTLYENKEGVSLFGEQKKFVLKTPTPAPEPAPTPETPIDAAPIDAAPAAEPSLDIEAPVPMDSAEPTDMAPEGGMPEGGEVSFKQVQKLTGKLAQKLREFKVSGELSSKDMKYVINSILSALDLASLEEGDREEILTRFETDEIDTDIESDVEIESPEIETPEEEMPVGEGWADESYEIPEEENPESRFTREIMDSIFAESLKNKTIKETYDEFDDAISQRDAYDEWSRKNDYDMSDYVSLKDIYGAIVNQEDMSYWEIKPKHYDILEILTKVGILKKEKGGVFKFIKEKNFNEFVKIIKYIESKKSSLFNPSQIKDIETGEDVIKRELLYSPFYIIDRNKIRLFRENREGLDGKLEYIGNMNVKTSNGENYLVSYSKGFGLGSNIYNIQINGYDVYNTRNEPLTFTINKRAFGKNTSIFAESKIEKVLTKYFERTKKEILSEQDKFNKKTQKLTKKVNAEFSEIENLAESFEQERESKKFLIKNPTFNFVGKTNKKSLVFESNNKQVKVTKEGEIL